MPGHVRLQSRPSFDDSCLDDRQLYKNSTLPKLNHTPGRGHTPSGRKTLQFMTDVHSFQFAGSDSEDDIGPPKEKPHGDTPQSPTPSTTKTIDENDASVDNSDTVMSRRTGDNPPLINTAENIQHSLQQRSADERDGGDDLSPLLPLRKARPPSTKFVPKDVNDVGGESSSATLDDLLAKQSPKQNADQTTTNDDNSKPQQTTKHTAPASVKTKNTKSLNRKPSMDDSFIEVKVPKPLIARVFNIQKPLNVIKNSFPSFDLFKKNIQKNKQKELFQKYLIDSEWLYTLLDHLSWSFSFHPEKRRSLTTQLLMDKKNTYTQSTIQKILQKHFNISVGDYEAKLLVQYVMLYSHQNHVDNHSVRMLDTGIELTIDFTVDRVETADEDEEGENDGDGTSRRVTGQETVDTEDDGTSVRQQDDEFTTKPPRRKRYSADDISVEDEFDSYTATNMPFSLLLPTNKTKAKWCDNIDKLAIRQFREASNLGAVNMTTVSRKPGNRNPRQALIPDSVPDDIAEKAATVSKTSSNDDDSKPAKISRRITKDELKEFRSLAAKQRPPHKRHKGCLLPVRVSVYKKPTENSVTPVNTDEADGNMQQLSVSEVSKNKKATPTDMYTSFNGRVYDLNAPGTEFASDFD